MLKKDTGRNRRRNNYGKVKADVEPGFEDCSKLFNGAEFECIELPGTLKAPCQSLRLKACTGRLLVLKCGNQMQRRTQARRDLLLQRQTRTWTFKQLLGDLRLKVQVSSTLIQCGQTISRYLLITSHILRKPIRIYDRKLVGNQETTWTTSIRTRWCGECFCLWRWMQQLILERIIWIMYIQRTIRKLFDVSQRLITDQTKFQGVLKIGWYTHPWQRRTLLTDKSSPIINSESPCILRFRIVSGQDESIPWIHRRMENKIEWFTSTPQYRELDRIDGEPMEFEWKFPRIHYITNSRRDPENDERNWVWTWVLLRTDCLHVQRHCMGIKRKQRIMYCEFQNRRRICKKIRARTLVVSRTWIRKETVRNKHVQTEWRMGWCRWTHTAQLQWKRTSRIPWNQCFGKRSFEKQRRWKIVLQTVQEVFRTIISTDMCDGLASRISECSACTGRPVAQDK